MGSIYKRGNIWWIQYYRNGKPYQESSKSKKKMVANELLKKREGEISQGKIPGIHFDRVFFDELAEGLVMDYKINEKKSLPSLNFSLKHLEDYFGGRRVTDITTPMVQEYIEQRLKTTCKDCGKKFDADDECPHCGSKKVKPGAKPASINRTLSALKRMLNLGAKQTPPKVNRVPYIPMLKENNTRKGFFEHGDFMSLHDRLPEYLKGFAMFAYNVGWRISEVSNLTWEQVDREQGIVRLEVGETKNDEGRTVYLDDELKQIFEDQWEKRKQNEVLIPYVFTNESGRDRVKEFRKTWNKTCRENGLGYGYKTSHAYVKKWEDKFNAGPTFHDFRRSAVRNMVRAGVPEQVAMKISGHKTRSVFDRYNIVSDADLKLAAQKRAEYLKSQTTAKTTAITHLDKKRINRDSD